VINVKAEGKAVRHWLIDQLNIRISDLEPGEEYELGRILGPHEWADEDDSDQVMGQCFGKFLGDGHAPFELLGFINDRHNNYYYIP
jgi:hypothetical protein